MKYRKRTYYTEAQKAVMWDRWENGEYLPQIALLFDRSHSAVHRILSESGGIRPATRVRSALFLTMGEREEISRALALGQSMRAIASALGRAPSTISREVTRNGGLGSYRAAVAEQLAWNNACRPKLCKLAKNRRLAILVAGKLQLQWSPQQIAGWMKLTYPGDETQHVSHETIYRSLFIQSWGALKKELLENLRRTRLMRRSRNHTQKTENHGKINGMVCISDRPAEIEDRAVPGHWEGDLLFGSRNTQIATLVERSSRYVMLVKVASKDTETVITSLIANARKMPQELYKSLTWDRGKEMAAHKRFTLATDINVYFCHPHSPWQRGSNENTNGLLRQYFPKGVEIASYTQTQLDAVARKINERPRKTLGYRTPAERFSQLVASTG